MKIDVDALRKKLKVEMEALRSRLHRLEKFNELIEEFGEEAFTFMTEFGEEGGDNGSKGITRSSVKVEAKEELEVKVPPPSTRSVRKTTCPRCGAGLFTKRGLSQHLSSIHGVTQTKLKLSQGSLKQGLQAEALMAIFTGVNATNDPTFSTKEVLETATKIDRFLADCKPGSITNITEWYGAGAIERVVGERPPRWRFTNEFLDVIERLWPVLLEKEGLRDER